MAHGNLRQCAQLQSRWGAAAPEADLQQLYPDRKRAVDIIYLSILTILCPGYCKIQWKESSTENPDPFKVGPPTDAIGGNGNKLCTNAFITIPNLRYGGVQWKT